MYKQDYKLPQFDYFQFGNVHCGSLGALRWRIEPRPNGWIPRCSTPGNGKTASALKNGRRTARRRISPSPRRGWSSWRSGFPNKKQSAAGKSPPRHSTAVTERVFWEGFFTGVPGG